MRVIIRCADDADRWGNYRGVPKHLVTLCGERLLERAVRLTHTFAPDADVKVVVRDMSDRRYLVPGSSRSRDKPNPGNGDVDKIASCRHLWDRKDRTVILFGDVWWGEFALRSVLTDPIDGWAAWGRITADGGGELFAFAFNPDYHRVVADACERVAEAHRSGRLEGRGHGGSPVPGGWALYRVLCGRQVDEGGDHGHLVHVTDWTDDMDTPDDWDRWCWRWATTDPAERPPMWEG